MAAGKKLFDLLKCGVEVLAPEGTFEGASSAIENLQYLYACGLVFIAARRIPFAVNAMGPKHISVPVFERSLSEICLLMGNTLFHSQCKKTRSKGNSGNSVDARASYESCLGLQEIWTILVPFQRVKFLFVRRGKGCTQGWTSLFLLKGLWSCLNPLRVTLLCSWAGLQAFR